MDKYIGFDIDSNKTVLYAAAFSGRKDVVEILLANGADIDSKHDLGHTLLHTAIVNNQEEVALLLVAKGANVNSRDIRGFTPLIWNDLRQVIIFSYLWFFLHFLNDTLRCRLLRR